MLPETEAPTLAQEEHAQSPAIPASEETSPAENPSPETKKAKEAGAQPKKAKKPGGIELFEPKPWPEPVEGATLLDAIRDAIRRHLALERGAAEAIALWVLFAHTHDAHRSSPRLAFISPVPECGKTTALSILGDLVSRPLKASNITAAVIFRMIEKYRPTLLIDEADTFLHGNEDMRGILNSGHTRATAVVWRCDGDNHEPTGFSTWAPLTIAKIGKLPATLESRSVVIEMRRRRPDEPVEPIRAEHSAAYRELARKAVRWAADHVGVLRASEPKMPEGLYNRTRDNWKPLLAIANAAGGHWPETARSVAVRLSGCAEDPSQSVQLLGDIRRVFDTKNEDRLSSSGLCGELGGMEDRPWCDFGSDGFQIKPKQLAKLLKPFGIVPNSVRIGDRTPKGYTRADFDDVFARYLPASPPASATPQQSSGSADISDADPQHRDAVAQPVADRDGSEAPEIRECCAVAD